MYFDEMARLRFTVVSVVLLFSLFSISSGLQFSGSSSCYAQYDMWDATTNGTLSFEFKTAKKEGLLAYMDDGGQYDFLELKVAEGHVRLRYRIGEAAQTVMLGDDMNDNNWHSVEVMRDFQKTTLIVDGARKAGSAKDDTETTLTSKSDLYVGGIPRTTRLTALALPSVMFDARFQGHIRNLKYGLGGGRWRNAQLLNQDGTKEHASDECVRNNKCEHDGLCISTDSGATCDCTGTGYEGEFCNVVSSSVATFDGESYFSYDLSRKSIRTQQDGIQFEFRTQKPNGLMLQTGNEYDYVYFGIEDGMLAYSMNLGSGALVQKIEHPKGGFHDNIWHKVVMTRRKQEITVTVDDTIISSGKTQGNFASFSSEDKFFVGGGPDPKSLHGSSVSENFLGCLRQVKYISNSLTLELSSLAKKSDNYITITGNIPFSCKDFEQTDPVTFKTPEAYLAIDKWDAKVTGSLSYRFRTNEPNGVLMYNNGEKAMSDFFAMELLDGYLNMILDLGSGAIKLKCHPNTLNDGQWHSVKVEKNKKQGTVQVDEGVTPFFVSGDNERLDLEGNFFIGGTDTSLEAEKLPREMWSGMLGHGFVGCMRDMVMNRRSVDLAEIARSKSVPDVGLYCTDQPAQCENQPCRNGGICSEGWNRFICDCSNTRYTGDTCYEDAATLSFDGTQYMRVTMQNESLTDTEQINLRFKTKRAYGLLMATTSSNGVDTLMMELDSGKVKLVVNLGAGPTELFAGEGLNDMQWHTVKVKRELQKVMLSVDDEEPVEGPSMPTGDVTDGFNRVLEFKKIEVGALSDESRKNLLLPPSNFLGHMEQFTMNGQKFFEMAKSGTFTNIQVTASFNNMDDQIISNPVTFKSREAFIVLSPPNTYPVLNLFFQFRTVEPNGLILFNDGDGNDFLAVELVDGYIHYVFNTGDKTSVMRANTVTRLNNNQWHEVTITRDNRDRQVLKVDDATTKTQPASGPRHIDLTENMRVGGIESDLYESLPEYVQSRYGYLGCIAALDMNGVVPNLIKDALNSPKKHIVRGCEAPNRECAPESCENRGECYQLWNDFSCDCDLTTYTGVRCETRGTQAKFEGSGGMITFMYPEGERPGTHSDRLAVGFRTRSRNAVIARIDSIESKDYIEMEIADGNLFVVYNMGTEDHPIGELMKKVNDNKYHVVRFLRSGANATLQVDDEPVIQKIVTGDQLKIFNSQTYVKLGARGDSKRSKRALEREFIGTMQGVHYNGVNAIDLALENDPRVTVEGDVTITQPPPGPEPTTKAPTEAPPKMPEKPTSTVSTTATTAMPTTTVETTTTMQTTTLQTTQQSTTQAITTLERSLTTQSAGPTEPKDMTSGEEEESPESGSGCSSDDEDDCESSGGGEIKPTPVKPDMKVTTTVPTTPSVTTTEMVTTRATTKAMTTKPQTTTVRSTMKPTTLPPIKHTTPMEKEPMEPEGSGKCDGTNDDEDCEDGSGSGDMEMETTTKAEMTPPIAIKPTTKVTEMPLPEPNVGDVTKRMKHPSTTDMPMPQPESTGKPGSMSTENKSDMDDKTVAMPEPVEPTKEKMRERTESMVTSPEPSHSTNSEGMAKPLAKSGLGQTAMVVGIVAAVCIAVLILLYAVYKYRNRNEGSYRIDESRNYSYGTPTGTVIMPNANGSLYNGKDAVNKPLMKKHDSREWYV
ncbi:neurexin-3-like isoform X4 [Ptychodera flava]|uniref:neurexin-3-like isoform X4 n=1 Tax=Ptychodera flava TaxID=63121 RepID=UPI00396A0BAA